MYKILADECVHKDVVDSLKSSGNYVQTVREAKMSGATDLEVFDYVVKNGLILFTFDRGFGDIFTFDISNSNGVVIELINFMEKQQIINIAKTFFSEDRNLEGKLVLIGRSKIRIIER